MESGNKNPYHQVLKYCSSYPNFNASEVEDPTRLLQNLSCLKMFSTLWKAEPHLKTEHALFSAAYLIITVFGVFGNGLVIFAVARKVEMRTSRNVLITNLAVSNFLLSLILYPFLWLPASNATFPYGRFFCKTVNAFPGSNICCSTLTITLMAMDRYYTIRNNSSRGCCGISKRRMAILSAIGIWFISLVFSLPLLLFYDIKAFPSEWANLRLAPNGTLHSESKPTCSLISVRPSVQTITRIVNVTQTSFLYFIPLVVLLVFNLRLTRYLHQNSLSGKETNNGRRKSQAAQAARKRSSRATKLLNAMAFSYGVLWFPFTLISFLIDFKIFENDMMILKLDGVAKLISMISICVNPFLYGFLNTNFSREFIEIFSKLPWCTPVMSKFFTVTSTNPRSSFSVATAHKTTPGNSLKRIQNAVERDSYSSALNPASPPPRASTNTSNKVIESVDNCIGDAPDEVFL